LAASKQMLPIYDKPMIYYPLCVLMLAGIRDILIISTPRDLPIFREMLGDGSRWGVSFAYVEQPEPEGIAQAYHLGADFVGDSPSALILGDNLFVGHGLFELCRRATARPQGATVFAYRVHDPERFGVIEFDAGHRAISIEEKPKKPRSKYVVTGLYFYDGKAVEYASRLKPSPRGELEITDLNRVYLERGELSVEVLGRGFAWLDTGTPESLFDATSYIRALEMRQGFRIGCPEEAAFRSGYIDREQLLKLAASLGKSGYGAYLAEVADDID